MTSSKQLIQFSFNDDGTKLTASTETSFVVIDVANFTPIASSSLFGGVRSINCLHHADLYLLVASGDKPGSSPRRAKIWKEGKLLQEIALPSTVERSVWNKFHLVLFTNHQIYLYELRTLALKATLPHCPGNMCGAMAVGDSHIFCYPAPDLIGQVIVHDCQENRVLHRFAAHRTEISQMVINSTGTLLCTASKTGTLVRIFQIPSGDLLYTFRISNTNDSVTSLQFCDQNSQYLLCGSGKNQWSICYLGEKTQKSMDEIINEKTLDFSEEDGDFCRIEVNTTMDGDNESEVGTENRSVFTHQSRPADADQNPGLISLATAQYLFDFTIKSVQQIRNLSQDYLHSDVNSAATSSTANARSSPTEAVSSRKGLARNTLRLQNDAIRSADWKCSINIDNEPAVACLVIDEKEEHDYVDDVSTLAGSVTAGGAGATDLNATLIDDGWKLKLLLLTKSGVFRRYTVNLPGHTRHGVISTSKQKITSPMLSGNSAETVLQLEEEKLIFDTL